MQIFVKTLKGTHFEIEVKPDDTVADVKKIIETSQGENVYPADQQMLIHQGKVLKDETTLVENNVAEKTFIVIMLRKGKASSGASTATAAPSSQGKGTVGGASTTADMPPSQPPPASSVAASPPAPPQAPAAVIVPTLGSTTPTTAASVPTDTTTNTADAYDQAASNLVAGNNLEQAVQQILDIGGGTWDRATVVRALRAAFNNPERAVEYLYSGIPEQAEVPPVARPPTGTPTTNNPPTPAAQLTQPAIPSSGPNSNPLDLFPQGLPSMGTNPGAGSLDFLRNSAQFRALQAMVQANPQILQPMLQELSRQNPHIMRLIQEHQAEFLRLINEPTTEGGESNLLGQLAASMPHALTVTPEEREAIERLEAMGFNRAIVLEVFFACNKNEELAANYLLDHMHEFEE